MIFNYDVSELQTAINDEATARANADTALQNAVNVAVRVITEDPLTSANDLNDYSNPGLYRIGATLPANCPAATNWSVLMVTSVGTTKNQTIFATSDTTLVIHQRIGNSTTWSAWQKISSADITDLQSTTSSLQSTVSGHTSSISSLQSAMTSEQTARQNADTALQNTLNGITPLDTTPTSGSSKGITSGAVYNKTNVTAITPSFVGTHFQITTHNVKYMNGFAFGSIVLKCTSSYTEDNNDYIQMPWTLSAYSYKSAKL